MDDAISTIVYLILTLIIVLGGLLGRKKKQQKPLTQKGRGESVKSPPATDSQTVQDTNPIDRFFSSLIDEHTDQPFAEGPVEDGTPDPEVGMEVKSLDSISVEEGSSAFTYDDQDTPMVEIQAEVDFIKDDEKQAFMDDLTILYQEEEKESDTSWDFDIRQAIIYSEILKPKF